MLNTFKALYRFILSYPFIDFSKVSLLEDADQNIHLKNLSTHLASNEEEALNLLFVGDTNRMIAEVSVKGMITFSCHSNLFTLA